MPLTPADFEDLLVAQQAAAALADAGDSDSDPITEAVEAAATEMAVESLLGGDASTSKDGHGVAMIFA